MRWRVLLFGVLLAALCDPPGFAGTWTASQIGPSQSSRYEWSTVDDSTKTLDATHCGAVAFGYADDVSGAGDTAASAELLSCKRKDATPSECSVVTTFSSDTAYITSNQRPGYYHVNVLTAPSVATSTARVDAYCALDLAGSGGSSATSVAALNAPITGFPKVTGRAEDLLLGKCTGIDVNGNLINSNCGNTFMSTVDPISGTDACDTGDMWDNTTTHNLWICEDGATDLWDRAGTPLLQTGTIIDLTTPCTRFGELRAASAGTGVNDFAVCINRVANDWHMYSSRPLKIVTGHMASPLGVLATTWGWTVEEPITLVNVSCITDVGTAQITLQECNSSAGACASNMSALTCSATGASTTTFSDSALVINEYVNMLLGTVAGGATQVAYTVRYRRTDNL